MKHLAVITPLAPQLAEHLPQTAASVEQAREQLAGSGWSISWHVCVDGPGAEGELPGAQLLRMPAAGGVSVARNLALAHAPEGAWVLPLDGDDLLHPPGLLELLGDPRLADVGWVSSNRCLVDGRELPFWTVDQPRRWQPGQLARQWQHGLPFHPNSLLVQRELALQVGGWPALRGHEDLLFALLLGEAAPGVSLTPVTLRYRLWPGQTVASPWWPHMRPLALRAMEQLINARRAGYGREPVQAPSPEQGGRISAQLRRLAQG